MASGGKHTQKHVKKTYGEAPRSGRAAAAKKRQKARGRALKIAVAVFLVIAIAAVYGFISFNDLLSRDEIFPGVWVGGVELSGLDRAEAAKALKAAGYENTSEVTVTIMLPDGKSLTVKSSQVGYGRSADTAAMLAHDYGREETSFAGKLGAYLSGVFGNDKDLPLPNAGSFNDNIALEMIRTFCAQANTDTVESVCNIQGGMLTVTKGISGIYADVEEVYILIRDAFYAGLDTVIDYDAHITEPAPVPLDAIWQQIHKDPVEPRYDGASRSVLPGEQGVSFDLERARELYNSAELGGSFTVPLTYAEPSSTVSDIEALLYRDVLGTSVTTLATSTANRVNNVTLAAASVNGLVLQPGDAFSFNGTVGKRTTAAGYLPAGAYIGGQTVDTVGGGICQCSSALYICALQAGLQIDHRLNHMFRVSYMPLGMDATVNWGTIDFNFTNNTDFPVRIETHVDSEAKTLNVRFVGTRLEEDNTHLVSVRLVQVDYNTYYVVDSALAPGNKYTKTSGYNASVVDVYRIWMPEDGQEPPEGMDLLRFSPGTVVQYIKDNATVQEELTEELTCYGTLISRDSYRKRDKIVVVASSDMIPEGGMLLEGTAPEDETETGGTTIPGEDIPAESSAAVE